MLIRCLLVMWLVVKCYGVLVCCMIVVLDVGSSVLVCGIFSVFEIDVGLILRLLISCVVMSWWKLLYVIGVDVGCSISNCVVNSMKKFVVISNFG